MNSVVAQIANLIPNLRPADRDTVRRMLDNGCCIVECGNDSKFVRFNRHRCESHESLHEISTIAKPHQNWVQYLTIMKKHFILYLDILGFSNLIDTPDKALEVLRIVDSLNVHRHEDFEVIFFSDTLLVFNKFEIQSEADSRYAVMFLCEFAQDLLFRCLGKGYFFRGIVTHGDFHRERMKNVDAFFGPATRDAHKAEKELKAVGLFIDNFCLQFSSVFHARRYNEGFSFVFLTQAISGLHFHHNSPANNAGSSPKSDEDAGVAFPLDWILVFASGLEDVLTKECSFLRSIGCAMKTQIDEPIRRKYETTWGLYKDQYPTFMKAFVDAGMQPDFISQGEWSEAKASLQEWESRRY